MKYSPFNFIIMYSIFINGKLRENLTKEQIEKIKEQNIYNIIYNHAKRIKKLENDSKEKKKS